jgi:hypothetical protein
MKATCIFTATGNEIWACPFAPCAVGRLLLKTEPARVRRPVAQKVLLSGRWFDNRLATSDLHRRRFMRKLMNTNTLKRHAVWRGKTSWRETQQHNLTKGRDQRQVNE